MLTGLPPFYTKNRDELFEKFSNYSILFINSKINKNYKKLKIIINIELNMVNWDIHKILIHI